jgi:hydroxymethylpyrimidine/phosphomethylpyrimidine kinase
MTKNLLSIAGYDPSGGAGVLLDIAVFARLGFHGFGALTAVTAQDPRRVARVFPLSARAVEGQVERLAATAAFSGIKVGMIGTTANLRSVARILARNERVPRVIDPVFRSTSGALLLEEAAWPCFLDVLEGKADLITPNLDEAEALTGRPVRSVAAMSRAAKRITLRSGIPCLVKGGHLRGQAVDVLHDGRESTTFEHPRVVKDVHGTGCYLTAAILGHLAGGFPLKDACRRGIAEVERAIRAAVPAGENRWVFRLSRPVVREGPAGRRRLRRPC